jgi:hypothetical protein
MNKYRKKPVVIEAQQWSLDSPHPAVSRYCQEEAKIGEILCRKCGLLKHAHGWVETLEGGYIVCPGDWIIKGIKGEFYPCKPDVFEATYEPADCVCDDPNIRWGTHGRGNAAAWDLELLDKAREQQRILGLQNEEIECWRNVAGGRMVAYQLAHSEWGRGPTLINVDSVIDNMLNEDGIWEVSRDDYKQLRDRLKALVPGQKCRYGNWIVTMTLVPIKKMASMHEWDGW